MSNKKSRLPNCILEEPHACMGQNREMTRVLDVGCGGSEQFKLHKVRGDINCDLLKPSFKIPNFVLCDVQHLPFKRNGFDKVFMYDVLEHLGNPLEALLEVKRVLRRKGILELGTPNALYLPKIIRSMFRGTYSPYRDHIITWGKAELNNLFSRAGLKRRVTYETYRDERKPLHYGFFVRICPFPSLKHRQLLTIGRK